MWIQDMQRLSKEAATGINSQICHNVQEKTVWSTGTRLCWIGAGMVINVHRYEYRKPINPFNKVKREYS
jgi:hypothetical protein